MNILSYYFEPGVYEQFQERLNEIYVIAEEDGRLTSYNEDIEVRVINAVASLFVEFCNILCDPSEELLLETLKDMFIEFVSNYTTPAQTKFCVQSVLYSQNPTLEPPTENQLRHELREEQEQANNCNANNRTA